MFNPDAQVEEIEAKLSTLVLDTENEMASLNGQISTLQEQVKTLQGQIVPVPPPGFTDLNLHGDWFLRTGNNIGPLDPKAVYSMTQFLPVVGEPYAMQLNLTGPKGDWSDVLWALARKHPSTPFSKVSYSGMLFIYPYSKNIQAIEIDTIITKNGYINNFSSQINLSRSGMLQISKGSGWIDTGIIINPAVGIWHSWKWEYLVDFAGKTFSHLAFTMDEMRWLIHTTLQNQPAVPTRNQPAVPTSWPDTIHPQLQLDVNSVGGSISVAYSRLDYNFS